jgi:F0F1-type ATP synthase assembly protein I
MTTPDTSGPTPDRTPGPVPDGAAEAAAEHATAAERRVLRTALRDTLLLVGALVVLGGGIGLLVAGVPGLWGALVGAAIAAFFCATTIWSMMRTVGSSPARMAAFVMGAWIAKIVVLIVVLALLQGRDFYDPWVLIAVLAVGAIGSALLDYRAVNSGRVPYVQP